MDPCRRCPGSGVAEYNRHAAGLAEWTGRGSEAFLRAATVIAGADSSLASSAAGAVSVLISGLAILVKEISKAIGRTLETIANFLITKAAEAATPVAGWAVA